MSTVRPRASRRDVFALLDDATAGAGRSTSRLYTGYVRSVINHDPAVFDAEWGEVESALSAGLHAVLVVDYEWGVRLNGVQPGSSAGVFRVLLFRRCRRCSARSVARWLRIIEGLAEPGAVAVVDVQADVDESRFNAAIDNIQHAITEGETYQVNYTYRLNGRMGGDPVALYRSLRKRQPVAYGALIALPENENGNGSSAVRHVLSFSPELFLRHEGGRLTARPMKGTAPRHADRARDLQAREQLASAKSRAENLMIVDLLRNDLGRVARIGSVSVPALFEIEAHATVWQMTSTITAERAPQRRFPELMRALFPCGSITGAPKHRTLGLIDQLEATPRGVYCGAIGWVDAAPAGAECPDFCLSVPIRTLTLGPPQAGWRSLQLGVGAGIVADSEAAQERAECQLKAQFLTGMDSAATGYALIETLYADGAGVRHLERHLDRQRLSAQALGFAASADIDAAVRATVLSAAENLPGPVPHRLRLLRHPDGRHELAVAALDALPAGPVTLLLADTALDESAWPLAHKTTLRAPYERALARALAAGPFDVLHFNRRGELTEGARSNVFVQIDGQWLTPALHCGVLPGVMRAVLLADPAWNAREAVLSRDDLSQAEAIVVCNALRGVLTARLHAATPQARVTR